MDFNMDSKHSHMYNRGYKFKQADQIATWLIV